MTAPWSNLLTTPRGLSFEWPMLLWALLLVPLALAAYVLIQRRRARYAVRFTNVDLLANLVERTPGWRRHLPTALYLAALSALILSLARPEATVPIPRNEATVLLVMDVSGSMNATDVQPSRLGAAKQAAGMFLDQLPPGIRVGLVAFAGTAQVMAPPTVDRNAVRSAVSALRANGGTAMGDGIVEALQSNRPVVDGQPPEAQPAEDELPPTVMLLLSDGANSAGDYQPLEAAAEATRLGVPIYAIALGTPAGVLDTPIGGGRIRRIAVPPDEVTLAQIAQTTNGRFFKAPTADDLRSVYQDLGARIGFRDEQQEVTVLFAAAALVLLVTGGALSAFWFNRFP